MYLIEYYDRIKSARVRYLNNTSFDTKKKANDEIKRIRKADRQHKYFHGFIRRIKFKIIKHNLIKEGLAIDRTTIKKAEI